MFILIVFFLTAKIFRLDVTDYEPFGGTEWRIVLYLKDIT